MDNKKYLNFDELPRKGDAKTSVYNVTSIHGPAILAQIKWYGQWRRYVFMHEPNMLFDVNCMNEIVSFINKLMLQRKVDQQNQS